MIELCVFKTQRPLRSMLTSCVLSILTALQVVHGLRPLQPALHRDYLAAVEKVVAPGKEAVLKVYREVTGSIIKSCTNNPIVQANMYVFVVILLPSAIGFSCSCDQLLTFLRRCSPTLKVR
jgi:hypothetical protein